MSPDESSGEHPAAPDADSAETGPLEHAEAVELRADGRTLAGHVVRYGDKHRSRAERFEAGAFAADRAADPLRLNVEHDRADTVLVPLPVEYRADGLAIETTLPPGRTAQRVERGELRGLSVGFRAVEERRDADGCRVIVRAHLDHVALVRRPAYPASVVELRADSADDDTRRRLI